MFDSANRGRMTHGSSKPGPKRSKPSTPAKQQGPSKGSPWGLRLWQGAQRRAPAAPASAPAAAEAPSAPSSATREAAAWAAGKPAISPAINIGRLALAATEWSAKPIHFIGIGGIGMSGLARICHARGLHISGCDSKASVGQQRLHELGLTVCVGHDPGHICDDVGLVVYSQAVSPNEPELLAARAAGVPVISRGELLAELTATKKLLAVAGAHGKTTTSGMCAQLLVQADWDPTIIVGGHSVALGTNARLGRGQYVVAETDESDGSFLLLHPSLAIVTNIDREHLNYYGTIENVIAAFRRFIAQIRPNGILIRCDDDPITRELPGRPQQIRYGITSATADVRATRIAAWGWGTEFDATFQGQRLGTFRVRVPGRHNVLNALGVVSAAIALDIPMQTAREALEAFRGTSRRFQMTQLPNDILFVDDYAHHPSEIRATLSADPSTGRRRVVVFQPHRFSRVQSLEREFVGAFERADGLIVTDIYSAFEAPVPQVSGERLAGLIRDQGLPWVRYVPRPDLLGYLRPFVQPNDTVFFLGAGDISELCHELASQLRQGHGTPR
jgi:UDP-N-acetylmuramate--alanine ligase